MSEAEGSGSGER